MLIVEISPDQAKYDERSGVSQKTGKPWIMREQQGYIHLGGTYPRLFKFTLGDNQVAYPAGKYKVSLSSFNVDRYSNLMVDRLCLEPLKS
ncbi:TPA: DNA-binding protein [Citrobacter werkmanii]|nr:DNA-binding protein [Citrobacter werkmanii]